MTQPDGEPSSRLAALAARFGADPAVLVDRVAALTAEGMPQREAIRRVVAQLAGGARQAAKDRRIAELKARRAESAAAVADATKRSLADREARRAARSVKHQGLFSRWAAAIGRVLDPSSPVQLSAEERVAFQRWRKENGE